VTVQTTDNRGAKSAPTQPINISVNQKILFRVGAIVINYFSLAVIIIIAAASLISFAWYVISRLMILKRRLRRDIKETQVMLHQDLRVLKEDFKAEVFLLERAQTTRALTKEEATILKNLNNRVNVIEEAMGRKFDELKKDIK
jgi:hypothetical protein